MCNVARAIATSFLLVAFVVAGAGSGAFAVDPLWRVSKSSGAVWVSTSSVHQATRTDDAVLNPGDSIRTGRNGRVLLVRGHETILISPNSVVGIPARTSQGLTTIIQQSGSILIEVEKRSGPHFEIETPYLAAVVKGTQFRVSVSPSESYVNVLRGQVEVTDFRSGQSALVTPGQMAKVWALGNGGLLLSGSGTLNSIRRGTPRTTTIMPIEASPEGLSAPDDAPTGKRVLAMAPRGDGAPLPTVFESGPRNDGFWNTSLDYLGRLVGKGNGKAQIRDQRDAAMIAIPIGFGVMIAVVVAVRRRRQKRKPK